MTETPLAGDLADQLVQVALRLDVDADGRLVDDQDVGVGGEPLGDRHLLLVAAGEVADGLRERRRADLERVDEGLDRAGLGAGRDQAEATGEPPPDGDRHVLA